MKIFTQQLLRYVPKAALFAFALLMLPAVAMGQDASTTERWKGSDYSTFTKGTDSDATRFYLYNVGTGKFVIAGGEWGTAAMLMYQDFGAAFTLVANGSNTGINTGARNYTTTAGTCFGVNYPELTTQGTWTSNTAANSFKVIFEAQMSGSDPSSYTRNLTFTRVETDSKSDIYTYYITENVTGSSTKTFYIGALKGVDSSNGKDDQEVASDEVAYTQTQDTQTGNKNYQWRFVTETQMKEVIRAENAANYGGLSANISYLIKDPYFDRNRNNDYNSWLVKSNADSGSEYLYQWLNGALSNGSTDLSGTTTTETPWNKAAKYKVEINSNEEGKYGFAMLDGIGTVSQTLSGLTGGWYKVECRGVAQGHTANLYATSGDNTVTDALTTKTDLKKVTTTTTSSWGTTYLSSIKASASGLLNIGQMLYGEAGKAYTHSVLIYVSATEGTTDGTLTFGIQKDEATQSTAYRANNYGRNYYYYDTDIVAFDNFNLYYMGKEKPFLLDEDKTDGGYITEQTGSNVTTFLHRTFTLNKWNSLVLPVSMTSAQIKQYFGSDAKVAKLSGVSTNHGSEAGQHASSNPLCIDFKTIDLSSENDKAIEAGQMYIINPTLAASDQYTPDDSETALACYNIGRHDFSGEKVEPTATYGTDDAADNAKRIQYVGTYVKLNADANGGTQKGSYVFSGGDMYHLASSMEIKGFRGWLNIVDSNGEVQPTATLSFALDNSGTITAIDGVTVDKPARSAAGVYNLNGQLVRSNSASLEGLQKGIYVVNGKKVIVK